MENKELIVAIENLTESVGSLNAIQNDIFNQDTSHDDMVSLKGKMQSVIDSNKELKDAITALAHVMQERQ